MNQSNSASRDSQCEIPERSYVFGVAKLTSLLFAEMAPLLVAHYKEISAHQDIPLDPDREAYEIMDKAGALRIFTIRTDEGFLAGYAVFFVRTNTHYRGSLQANQDILFLHPNYRGRFVGFRFIKYCDEQLKNEGVQLVYQHVKLAHNFGPMLERIGYRPVETIYGRRLDKEDA